MADDCAGQALVETLLALLLSTGAILGCGALLKTEWQRARCARAAFESAHALLMDVRDPRSQETSVTRFETATQVTAEARCDKLRETVSLWKLESVSW